MCYSGYINIDRANSSRSGLYGSDLPGVEISMLDGLTKEDQEDYHEFWSMIESRAWNNLISDVSLAMQGKFHVDSKLVTRETSVFKDGYNSGTGLSGLKIEFSLPKYARIHIISVEVFSSSDYGSPGAGIQIYDTDETGELLYETDEVISEGRNTINIDQDFTVDNLYIAYDPDLFELKETENKYYTSPYISWDPYECIFPCAGWGNNYTGKITHVNGGGVNIKYVIYCSVEKYVCENINLFKMAYWYRIGVELMDEQLLGNRLNRFTTMTTERAAERSGYFGGKYESNIKEAIDSQKISEDPICFRCKNTVSAKTILP